MPHRSPGSPKKSQKSFLAGKPIRYYRPQGSADIRRLIDEGFQAFNAARLGEACHIYTDKMLSPAHDTTIGLTVAGALTPAGLGGCIIELMERGLVDFIISTGANLYHDLHYALNFTLHRGSPFLDDRVLYEQGVIRIYDVLFPAKVLLDTDAFIREFLVATALEGPVSTAEFHFALGEHLRQTRPGCEEYSVVASAAKYGVPIYTSSPGDSSIGMNVAFHELMNDGTLMIDPNKDVNEVCAFILERRQERLRDPRRRLAEELLPAGPADVVGGVRHPQGRQRLLHPDHDRSGRLGWAVGRDAVGSGQLGQGESWRAARHGRGVRRLHDRVPALLRVRRRPQERPSQAEGAGASTRRAGRGAQGRSHQGAQAGAGKKPAAQAKGRADQELI